jgi:hypothetical protein
MRRPFVLSCSPTVPTSDPNTCLVTARGRAYCFHSEKSLLEMNGCANSCSDMVGENVTLTRVSIDSVFDSRSEKT